MSIRKFRKNTKPVLIVMAAMFILSSLGLAIMQFKGTRSAQKGLTFSINGNKVGYIDVERKMEMFNTEDRRFDKVDMELKKTLAFDESVNEVLALQVAKKKKITVPSSEIEKQFKLIQDQMPKEQFKRMLTMQGYTGKTYKDMIEKQLTILKLKENLIETSVPTEKEIEETYYLLGVPEPLEEIKEKVIELTKSILGGIEYRKLINIEKKNMKIENLNGDYSKYLEKVEIEKDGEKATNVDVANEMLVNVAAVGNNGEDLNETILELFSKNVQTTIKSRMDVISTAKKAGILLDDELQLIDKVTLSIRGLYYKYRDDVVVTDEKLQKYFEDNKEKYITRATAEAKIIKIDVKPTEDDKKKVIEAAEALLKEVTPENFDEIGLGKAKENNNIIFEELGFFTKGQMVKEFEEAAFSEEGKGVYPKTVETLFGIHLLNIKDKQDDKVEASHILFYIKPSTETLLEMGKKSDEIIEKIGKNEFNFENINDSEKDIPNGVVYEKIDKEGYIPNLGYYPEITKVIFDAELNKISKVHNEKSNELYIFEKNSEIKEKIPTFDEMKEKVTADYRSEEARKVLEEQVK